MVVDSYQYCVTPYCSMVMVQFDYRKKKNFSGIWYAFLAESIHDHIPDIMDRCHYSWPQFSYFQVPIQLRMKLNSLSQFIALQ